MKNFKNALMLTAVVIACSLFLKCQKENDGPASPDKEVAFSINISEFANKSLTKSAEGYELGDADKIFITIQENDGSPTKYTSSEIKIQQMNGKYYTQKIVLQTGSYKLTEFIIVDESDSSIFASPLAGSPEAQNVTSPLPVSFTVSKDTTSYVDVEVISTEKKSPEDFGYNRFPITEIKTFSFMVGVSDYETDKLFGIEINISNGSWTYNQILDSISNNVVTIKDGLAEYKITVEKFGYETYDFTFSNDSLKNHTDSAGNMPLMIELKRPTVTDYDGNIYKTVVIGDQIWMAENLRTTHYSDGTPIPDGASVGAIGLDYSLKYHFVYNNDPANLAVYGRLYTWAAMMNGESSSNTNPSGVQGISPVGWHVPSDAEWAELTEYLGGASVAGGKLKETGTAHWNSPNEGATNETGFTALPAGYYSYDGISGYIGQNAYFWSTSLNTYAFSRGLAWSNAVIGWGESPQSHGFSVRCIKD